ncbi:MAG: transposase, partial [Thermoplasmatota archaeon]
EQKHREWVKLHACVGVRSKIITDPIVTPGKGKGTGDKSNFATLVEGTGEGFQVKEVSADGAYATKQNHHAVKLLGGEALIPFHEGFELGHRSYAGGPAAKTWRKAFHYFALHQDEFWGRYHKRSNVESTFSGIKRTLGEGLVSKKPLAQQNEVLCKVIAWNIRCVVRAMMELGVEPVFGERRVMELPEV